MRRIRKWFMLPLIAGFAGHVPAQAAASPCATTGTVVSTEASGPYTYVQLDLGGSNIWYAVPATELETGDSVVAPPGMPMKDFYSKTLNRTFDLVYFADGIRKVGAEATTLPAGHPPIQAGLPAGHPAIHGALPPGHPAIAATTNAACCANTNSATQ